MKRTILQQYNIKELDPGTKDWEEIYLKDGKADGMD